MHTAIICASGPSLTPVDCQIAARSGIPVVAVNSSWRAIPECTHIYAGDLRWWDVNIPALPDGPERWSCNRRAHTRYGVNLFPTDTSGTFNSGQRAILLAHWLGAKNVILLGFDCSISNGSHWHGDHTALDNPTAANVKRWHGEFARVAAQLRGSVQIINSSRQTALNCFRRLPLEAAISEVTC
ncbi:TPA: hypothetical protein NK762_000759 [Enterobacter chengduensis]|nr:hypothetical protein [Enterobacter chengduensis]MBT1962884.1 hypothetical protein [Enterobacter chengduensis]QEL34857.1 hypothetical protein FY206_05260 [Enterobacter chengduensis]HCD3310209.1 hypothetical protein [Enterobacter chengduensis]HCH6696687.1 hypothetical protein [Enterobacter chengduensis]